MAREYRERLIEEVRKYPVLWDTQHEHHRDIEFRDKCWHQISRKLGANSEVVKREWKTLRDSLRQSLRARPGGVTSRWRYQARMAFLLPFMTKRKQPRVRIKSDEEADTDLQRWAQHPTPTPASSHHPAHTAASAAGSSLGLGCVGGEGGGGGEVEAEELVLAGVSCAMRRLPPPARRRLLRAVLLALHQEEDALALHNDTDTPQPHLNDEY